MIAGHTGRENRGFFSHPPKSPTPPLYRGRERVDLVSVSASDVVTTSRSGSQRQMCTSLSPVTEDLCNEGKIVIETEYVGSSVHTKVYTLTIHTYTHKPSHYIFLYLSVKTFVLKF